MLEEGDDVFCEDTVKGGPPLSHFPYSLIGCLTPGEGGEERVPGGRRGEYPRGLGRRVSPGVEQCGRRRDYQTYRNYLEVHLLDRNFP